MDSELKPPFEIIYFDNHLLVINKPAGMLSQADRTGDSDVLTLGKQFLKEKFSKPGKVFLGLAHRLDRPVSGVMVLARTSKAAQRLSAQFRRRTPQKKYIAIVEGQLSGKGICENYLVKKNERVAVVSENHPGSKRAVLRWRTLSANAGLSLVEVLLETGRPHQIRVQLSHLGYPIPGDFKYGAKRAFDHRNLALHCQSLRIEHPTKKTPMLFHAKPGRIWRKYFGNL